MTIQSHSTLNTPVNLSQFSREASGNSNTNESNAAPSNNIKREDSTNVLATPSTTSMDSQTTPSPMVTASPAVGVLGTVTSATARALNDGQATTGTGTAPPPPLPPTTTTPIATASSSATAQPKIEASSTFYFGDEDGEIATLNLSTLLPKKTKHGRIGGSLYRALRDAGVDVAALGIPRGRPPRIVVGQKRPKRPTLLSLIKSGAELPMVPGAPPLRIVNVPEEAMPMEKVGEGQGKEGRLQDVTNRPQRQERGGGGPRIYSRRVGGAAGMSNKRARVEEEVGEKRGRGGQPGPMEGLVADDEAATGLLLLLGETSA